MGWLFDVIVPLAACRRWRTANCLLYSLDLDACPHRPASLRNLTADTMRRTDTHIVLPFAMLRTVMSQIAATALCIVGDTVVRPLKLPQGLHTSGAGAILNAAWQRDRKFRCPQIPPTVRSLMRIFACIYVDDACITMPYVSGDADTEAAADAALAELSSTDGPFTHLPLYAPPIAITTEPGTKFLETDILVMMGGSQLAAAHRNPDVGRMLATYAAQNHRIVPAHTRVSADAQLSYVLGMLSRVEQNCTYLLHTASAVLEMVVELRLHGWSPMVVTKALRSRLDAAGDGDGRAAYLLVLDVLRECNNQALHPEREQPSVRPAIGTARAMVLSRAAAGR
eukprot:COSAG02_NODE_11145_length_1784_cov_1.182196_3_plen_339_part_00